MFDKNKIRKDTTFKQLFLMLIGKSKSGGGYADIAEELIIYAKDKKRKVYGFYLPDFVEEYKDVFARSSIYKVASIMKQLGMLEYSGITGKWSLSNEFGNAGKRLYRWWKDFINEPDKNQ